MISGTRNMMQARIDEKAEVLRRLIGRTPALIKEEFKSLDAEAKSISENESNGDPDIRDSLYGSIYASQRLEDEEWMLLEFYRSMALLIYSYLETTMKSIMKRPSIKRKWSIGFLQYSYTQIKDQYELSGFPEIEFFWPNYSSFLEKRKQITHGNKDYDDLYDYEETFVEEDELIKALEGVHRLLRSIADAIDIKSKGHIDQSTDYLWTP